MGGGEEMSACLDKLKASMLEVHQEYIKQIQDRDFDQRVIEETYGKLQDLLTNKKLPTKIQILAEVLKDELEAL